MVRSNLSYCPFCKKDLAPNTGVSWFIDAIRGSFFPFENHGESRPHLEAVKAVLFDRQGLNNLALDMRPTKIERDLVSECRAQLKKALDLSDDHLFMTGSIGRGTALRGAFDFDVVVIWKSSGLEAKSEIEELLRSSGSGFAIDQKKSRTALVFAHYKNIELDIAPRRENFDHHGGPLGHVYNFEREPERHNDLVRFLKCWARTHVQLPGILLEVVVREVRSVDPSFDLPRGFVIALQLLLEERKWFDPLDEDNDLTRRLGRNKWKKLWRWCRKTLGMWRSKSVWLPRQNIGRIIGKRGEEIRCLEEDTQAIYIIPRTSNADFCDIQVHALTGDMLSMAIESLLKLSDGSLQQNSWVLLESDGSYDQSENSERSSRLQLVYLAMSFGFTAIRSFMHATHFVVDALARRDRDEPIMISPRKLWKDAAGRRLTQFAAWWVPKHLLGRVIGEFGATIRNMEAETGAKFDIDDEDSAVCIYAGTHHSLNMAQRRLIDIVGHSRLIPVENHWNIIGR